MAVGIALVEEDVGPVGIGLAVPPAVGDEFLAGAQEAGGVLEVDVLLRVHHLGVVAEGAPRELVVVEDLAVLALGAALGGDEDDAVTGLRAVDGGGRGILQDFHGLDHGRIQILDVVHLQAVHDEERSEAGAAVGGDTADADVGFLARRAGIRIDLDAGGLALQGRGRVGRGTVHQFLRTDGRHGTGQVALALDTVTDDDRFVEELGVLLEDHLEFDLVAHRNHLAGISDAGELEGGAGGHVQPERAAGVSHRSHGRVADHHHGGSDDRSALGVDNRAPDCLVLRGRGNAAQECQQDRNRACQAQQFFKHVG